MRKKSSHRSYSETNLPSTLNPRPPTHEEIAKATAAWLAAGNRIQAIGSPLSMLLFKTVHHNQNAADFRGGRAATGRTDTLGAE